MSSSPSNSHRGVKRSRANSPDSDDYYPANVKVQDLTRQNSNSGLHQSSPSAPSQSSSNGSNQSTLYGPSQSTQNVSGFNQSAINSSYPNVINGSFQSFINGPNPNATNGLNHNAQINGSNKIFQNTNGSNQNTLNTNGLNQIAPINGSNQIAQNTNGSIQTSINGPNPNGMNQNVQNSVNQNAHNMSRMNAPVNVAPSSQMLQRQKATLNSFPMQQSRVNPANSVNVNPYAVGPYSHAFRRNQQIFQGPVRNHQKLWSRVQSHQMSLPNPQNQQIFLPSARNQQIPPLNVQNQQMPPQNVQNQQMFHTNAQKQQMFPPNAQNHQMPPQNAQNQQMFPSLAQSQPAFFLNARKQQTMSTNLQNHQNPLPNAQMQQIFNPNAQNQQNFVQNVQHQMAQALSSQPFVPNGQNQQNYLGYSQMQQVNANATNGQLITNAQNQQRTIPVSLNQQVFPNSLVRSHAQHQQAMPNPFNALISRHQTPRFLVQNAHLQPNLMQQGPSNGKYLYCSKTNRVVSTENWGEKIPNFDEANPQVGDKEKFVGVDVKLTEKDEKEDCAVCLGPYKEGGPLKGTGVCKHFFHEECIKGCLKNDSKCPICRKVIIKTLGPCPNGCMYIARDPNARCQGHNDCGVIRIRYVVEPGVQEPKHPNPGKSFNGDHRQAFLPDNEEGRKVLELLKKAWLRRLTLTVGPSLTRGVNDVVTWNDIHHKTSLDGGPYGYPDAGYLQRVTEDMNALGVKLDE